MTVTGPLLTGGPVAMRRAGADPGSAERVPQARSARAEIDPDDFRRVRDLLRTR